MKILLAAGIYPPEIGGPASFAPRMAEYLRSQGHDVFVITYGDEKTDRGSTGSVTVVSRSGGVLARYVRYAWRAWRLVRQHRLSLVFAQGPVSEGFPAAIVALCARIPFVMKVVGDVAWEAASAHGVEETLDVFVERRHAGKIGMLERIERWTASRAVSIVVPSQYLQSIVMRWGVVKEKIEVIYNQVEVAPVLSMAEKRELREMHGLSEADRVLVSVARFVPWKQMDFLVRVMEKLPLNKKLVLIGDGPEFSRVKALTQEKELSSRVLLIGRQPPRTVQAWYRLADLFLLPSLYEGLPHVALEALEAGVPVIVSDRGGNPEVQTLYGADWVTVLPPVNALQWAESIRAQLNRESRPSLPKPFSRGMESAYEHWLSRYV